MNNQEGHDVVMDVNQIKEYLPHRYPFLLVDRVLELTLGESIVAQKNVSINEPFFDGHFPNHPVMPGLLIIEALAQASGILSFKTTDIKPMETRAHYYLVGVENARFKQIVVPGDQLILQVQFEKRRRDLWCFKAQAVVAGKTVCSTDIMTIRKDDMP